MSNTLLIIFWLLIAVASALKELAMLVEVGTHGHSYFPLKSQYRDLLLTDDPIEDYDAKNITALGIR